MRKHPIQKAPSLTIILDGHRGLLSLWGVKQPWAKIQVYCFIFYRNTGHDQ